MTLEQSPDKQTPLVEQLRSLASSDSNTIAFAGQAKQLMDWAADTIEAANAALRSQPSAIEPPFPKAAEIRLAMGDMTASEMRTAVAAIRWTFSLFATARTERKPT